ncbi:TetR family transcriptional regulator [Mycolicibacterium wolinskyi]|uniref:TetR family transcriptional regulator n=1 Tax=Mycolicibacterium wolinskyi TaxID=59750 RepID=A0A132PTJ5_9MYCO|nr:TetR/AcrR family transcriptional regulator [Mycolicibacterium wolinskyi]KWX25661.1 TetR family transcriptional regulator [Mycolicibacterium wolinskyi]
MAASNSTDPRKQRTVDALLSAAEGVFAVLPFEEVTVDEIAARAGVAVGSIYNNFGSKSALYAAVIERALDVDREYMDKAYTPERSPIEQLEAAAEQYFRFYLDQPEFFRMLAFPPPPGPYAAAAETAERLARRVDEQNARMVDAIERGIHDGTIRPLDARKAATVLWASWNGIISLAWRTDGLHQGDEALAELLALAADVVGRGLRA